MPSFLNKLPHWQHCYTITPPDLSSGKIFELVYHCIVMIRVQEIIIDLINDAVTKFKFTEDVDIILEHPADLAHGDYSCNIAMRLAKELGKNPKELAQEIAKGLPENKYIDRVEVAGPGFINFYLSEDFIEQSIQNALSNGDTLIQTDSLKDKKILLEHSSPNLFKPFHIGHLVNNSYGDALVHILKAAGAEVTVLSFPSDVSPGIAKAVWGVIQMGLQESLTIEQIGEAYVLGSKAYKEDIKVKEQIDKINTIIYNQENSKELEVYNKGKEISLKYFKDITKRLGSEFADFIYESQAERVGKEVVQNNVPRVFTESDGAIIFEGSKYGLFDNVYINSVGFGTYLAKDTGLLKIKFDNYDFDKSITITDIEQKQHFELVKKSAELINKQWSDKSLYLQHGRLSLTTGKISSRDGGVPLALDIIEMVKNKAKQKSKDSDNIMLDDIAEQVAIGAIKYAILKVGMGKNIVFDLDKSLSFEGDSGPYLQYTYARCKSVLEKAYPHRGEYKAQIPKDWEVTNIEKLLYRFSEIVERSVLEYTPHYIANYLNDLASAYNSWYGQDKILDGTDAEQYKLTLTQATATIIKNGLNILNIDTPERM